METAKKPHMWVAMLMTVASLFSIVSLSVVIGSGRDRGLVILHIVSFLLMAFMAISLWVVYFQKYVDYRIQQQTASQERQII